MVKRALFLGIDALGKWAAAVYKNGHLSKARTRRLLRTIAAFGLKSGGDNGRAEFDGLVFNYLDREAFSYNFEEVFINEEYFFQTESSEPVIIDCGSNIGLAVIYFKTVFPSARITAIEANPATFAALEKNVLDNKLSGVTTVNAATASVGTGEVSLFFSRPGDLRSTNVAAMRAGESGLIETKVPALRLADLIDDRVDLLKIDIEGAEVDLIDDIAPRLSNVRNVIIEYHYSGKATRKTLGEFLQILESSGFYCRVKADHRADKHAKVGSDFVVTIYGSR